MWVDSTTCQVNRRRLCRSAIGVIYYVHFRCHGVDELPWHTTQHTRPGSVYPVYTVQRTRCTKCAVTDTTTLFTISVGYHRSIVAHPTSIRLVDLFELCVVASWVEWFCHACGSAEVTEMKDTAVRRVLCVQVHETCPLPSSCLCSCGRVWK